MKRSKYLTLNIWKKTKQCIRRRICPGWTCLEYRHKDCHTHAKLFRVVVRFGYRCLSTVACACVCWYNSDSYMFVFISCMYYLVWIDRNSDNILLFSAIILTIRVVSHSSNTCLSHTVTQPTRCPLSHSFPQSPLFLVLLVESSTHTWFLWLQLDVNTLLIYYVCKGNQFRHWR